MRDHGFKAPTRKAEYGTGATGDDTTGKGRYDLLPTRALFRVALVFERGAVHHGDRNWEKGIPANVNYDKALRHLCQALEGQSDEDHLAHAAVRILMLMELQSRGKDNDRRSNPE